MSLSIFKHQSLIVLDIFIFLDECARFPCLFGGTCVDGVNSFSCICPPGYGDTDCSERPDQCSSDVCADTGFCVDDYTNNYVYCVCNAGFENGKQFLLFFPILHVQ